MSNFVFGSTISKKRPRIMLTRREGISNSSSYYTYTDKLGNEQLYTNDYLNITSSNVATGKISETHKVKLTYHPGLETVISHPAYFTYIDENDNEVIFTGDIANTEYDPITYSYIFTCNEIVYTDKYIQIFKEE